MIEIQNVSKIYHTSSQDVLALDDVSLHVKKGEIFGIIGLSGAGKSTLIRCINMLEKPSSGRIIVDGEDITALEKHLLREKRQKIGMIFQHFNLLSSRTVFDNIMFPLEIARVPRKEAQQRVMELLEMVELVDKARAYPEQLSGGQKQRVGIARALANDPKILLSDEATSALDPQTTSSILHLLKEINRQLNLTILLITHDMGVIKEVCDRVAVIDNSKIVEVGDVLSILASPSSPTSKSFVGTMMNQELPEDLLHHNGNSSTIIRVSFVGTSTGEPVISSMIQNYSIHANILYANIDRVKDTPFGILTLELMGPKDAVDEGIHFLHEQGVEIEVLKNA
ncbi:MAG TPA: methionine ABC transporter ATP-binding protein [Syntrophomonadaceae bacterium]|nr:methionine ABC transporter ATP-binding protein [Syntrophomonadaceae bacterium]